MKSDHIWKRSKPNKQPTKRMNCPVKFGINISIYKIKSKRKWYDYGIFAIAFAPNLAGSYKPEQRTYNQNVTRKHLHALFI